MITSTAERERETIVAYLRERQRAYPIDIFPEPPPGEHGATVDACSARAARIVLGSCIAELERGYHRPQDPAVAPPTANPEVPGDGARSLVAERAPGSGIAKGAPACCPGYGIVGKCCVATLASSVRDGAST